MARSAALECCVKDIFVFSNMFPFFSAISALTFCKLLRYVETLFAVAVLGFLIPHGRIEKLDV